jgi:hypothetical protein
MRHIIAYTPTIVLQQGRQQQQPGKNRRYQQFHPIDECLPECDGW